MFENLYFWYFKCWRTYFRWLFNKWYLAVKVFKFGKLNWNRSSVILIKTGYYRDRVKTQKFKLLIVYMKIHKCCDNTKLKNKQVIFCQRNINSYYPLSRLNEIETVRAQTKDHFSWLSICFRYYGLGVDILYMVNGI